jgi:hypothetical protein
MKTRSSRLLNIFGINLLLLALYLNFIHEDNNTAPELPVKRSTQQRTISQQNNGPATNPATVMVKKGTALN